MDVGGPFAMIILTNVTVELRAENLGWNMYAKIQHEIKIGEKFQIMNNQEYF